MGRKGCGRRCLMRPDPIPTQALGPRVGDICVHIRRGSDAIHPPLPSFLHFQYMFRLLGSPTLECTVVAFGIAGDT